MCMGPWIPFRTIGGVHWGQIYPRKIVSLIKAKIVTELKMNWKFWCPFLTLLQPLVSRQLDLKASLCGIWCAWVHAPQSGSLGRHMGPNLPLQDCESPIKARTINKWKFGRPFWQLSGLWFQENELDSVCGTGCVWVSGPHLGWVPKRGQIYPIRMLQDQKLLTMEVQRAF